ncbi:mannosyltransferase [Metschnikowia bicuspidata var. bicuspidata NRRL YB-4993]|uniref:GPI mannosyltransferase 2 n=1 Tax=Metschnikowia bicuspidata var. bicuspidata NRRL YB-4993 TaxID=869754 RepID=A0A1A0HDE5_9ASCO|nr:mannosyltransferase [Metschnikowia bicuspidata var. bicuspidata NRRL YB-4993]OBA21917.1 mannosyltransferase [Metschnikowia bicuspidata var. bicuspidata NRRL YB-4993]
MPHLKTVIYLVILFFAVKSAQFVIVILGPAQFDVSSSILLESYLTEKIALSTFGTRSEPLNHALGKSVSLILDRFLDRLVTWDAVYFADLFSRGILYEHQFVFCPLWWRLIHVIPVNPETGFYSRLIWATVLANLSHLAAAIVLYFYTLTVFKRARIFSSERMATLALMLYVCSPAAAFLTAPYSESIAALCSLLCLFARDVTCIYLASGALAALAFGFRANCLLLGLVYVYDIVYKKTQTPFLPLAAGLILGAAFLAAQIHSYVLVCPSGRGAWCEARIPSLFAYAQSHYWGNGLFRYWTWNNVPNFVFAAPTVFLLALAVRYFAQIYPVERTLPVLAVNCVFLCLVMLFGHVQIITRIHTFLPVVYWVVAGLLTQPDPRGQKWAYKWVAYFVVWNVLQTALFSAFLPPA